MSSSTSMRAVLPLALALAIAPAATAQRPVTTAAPAAAATDINIAFERYTLPNGLTVILAPDASTPQVAVDVWYHVGSKNEVPGRTGFAHLFEHVMFTGSGHVPYGLHDRLTEGVGGNNNGSTSNDRTNYYQTVPSNYLETMFWLEADRMGFLLETLDTVKFVAQRDVVQNERRQGVDNQPYGRAFEIMASAMYAPSHPYSWPVIGYMTDLQAASLEDVRAFFRTYYAPTNATIAIVGDFQPAEARRLVAKYFGDLPRGPAITRPAVAPPSLTGEQRLVYEDRVQVPRLYLRWPTVGTTHDDTYALTFLGEVLTASRTARLTKALVYDAQSAASVSAGQGSRESVGEFAITITPRPGNTLTSLEAETDSVIERLKREGPTEEEMAKARAGIEFDFVSSLESNLGKAEMLLSGQVFHGDPGRFRTDYARYRAVTAADVHRVARTYLGGNRVVLSVVPQGQAEQAAKPDKSMKVTVSPDGGRYILGSDR
ncbi:MAG TPA: pitrilysin family protein [Gemmatimonadaceae bacterium]|nr:pitrilysin family protein [Gemmatimonadaceae bacterium]